MMKKNVKTQNFFIGICSVFLLLILILFGVLWTSMLDKESVLRPHHTDVHDSLIVEIINYEIARTKKQSVVGARKPSVQADATTKDHSSKSSKTKTYDDSVVSVNNSFRKGKMDEAESIASPNSTELDDLEWLNASTSIDVLLQQAEDANRSWTFGWILLKYPLQSEEIAKNLRRFGARVLGQSGNLVRLRVPKNRKNLAAITQFSWIAGIGALPPSHKVRSNFEELVEDNASSGFIPVFVTVMTSKMEDLFRSELKRIGLDVGHFDPSIRTFSAVMRRNQLFNLVALDFVQTVEPIATVTASHDSAIPAVGGDALRSVAGSHGSYTGFTGVSVPIGIIDTGLNANHIALSSLRKSICGTNFVRGEDHDLWSDRYGHGTHVTGTLAGNGYFQPKYAGVAPAVEHIRVAKVLNRFGFGSTSNVLKGMDFLAKSTSCPAEGWSTDQVRPLIVNMSLSNTRLEWDGRSTGPRKLDSIVWTHRQLYVVANSNARNIGFSNYASAKNSLAVGNVYDNGDLSETSSLGPTADGRLLPLVVGPGTNVMSAEGNDSYDGYRELSGTSMSAPCVAGIAALLMDASPDHREEPALVRARLMASAVRPAAWLESDVAFPKNNTNGPGTMQAKYGMGLVSARTSILNRDVPEGWSSSGATLTLEDGEYGYQDIVVPVGTERLDVVLTWDEPPADRIASTVLNDLDLWLDHGADCGSSPCGEHSSRSKIDNVEWVIIQDPEPGTYRIQVSGERIFTEAPRAGVAWTMIRGSDAPQLTLVADQTVYEVASGEDHKHQVGVTISTDGYVATGSVLHIDCRTADDEPCESFGFYTSYTTDFFRNFRGLIQREDDINVDLSYVQEIHLGEIGHGEEQHVVLHLAAKSEGPLTVYFTATSWNGKSASTSIVFRESDSDDEPSGTRSAPDNDEYDSPTVLARQGGILEIDTLLATTESGEPIANVTNRRPTHSLWFQWTAARSGLASFVASPRVKLPSWYLALYPPVVDVFLATGHCCGIASAQYVDSADWSVQFFAEQGMEYRIRVSGSYASMPLTLNWRFGERPPNDNFADATSLTGASGTVAGHNIGATIEPGELYGTLASTIWYRWTAPEDGDWEFQIEDAPVVLVLVFSGDSIDDLRLVSGVSEPGDPVSVTAAQDEIYYIMVASPSAFFGGWRFDNLTWEQQDITRRRWDWFDSGTQLTAAESGSVTLVHESLLGVEPNEPEATGIQTGWVKWTAPENGRYTWYWNRSQFQVNAFEGNAIGELSAKDAGANNVVSSQTAMVFDASGGEDYAIALGRDKDDDQAYVFNPSLSTLLRWGKTPENNWLTGAISLSGSAGSMVGVNEYATTGSSRRTNLGYSSLWYSYEADEAGWYKFWIASGSSTSILSAFHPTEVNLNPELIMASRTNGIPGEGVEVTVYIEGGSSVLLRVGSTQPHPTSTFELHWSTTDPPNWLLYRGRVAQGERDATGQVISSLSDLTDLAFNSDGTLLFASTDSGISVFDREPTTGNLTLQQEIADPDARSFLVWDSYRDRLYAHNQNNWWTLKTNSEDESEFVLDKTEHGIGDGFTFTTYGSPILFLGNSGDYLYRTTDLSQSVYSFNSDSTFKFVGDNSVTNTYSVYPTPDGNFWWRWVFDEEQLLGREVGSGLFQAISRPLRDIPGNRIAGAFASDDEYFFATYQRSWSHVDVVVYSIDYLTGAIERISSERFFLRLYECAAAIPRTDSFALDVLCSRGAYVVEYSPEDEEITLSDFVLNAPPQQRINDRFGRRIPSYRLPSLSSTSPIEASPDGRHVYVATREHGLLTFERYGNEVIDLPEVEAERVRRLDLLQASSNQIQFDDDIAENGCITASEWVVDSVNYTVVDSKWQQRTVDSEWSDIEGTEEIGRLCSYSPSDSKEYRMVATFTREGETIEFASNFYGEVVYQRLSSLTVESGEITLETLSISECTEVLNLVVNGVKYTVKESKWQVRDDSDSDWSEVDSTITAGELCPYEPDDNREYRLVGRFVIDDAEDYYSSNVMQEESN